MRRDSVLAGLWASIGLVATLAAAEEPKAPEKGKPSADIPKLDGVWRGYTVLGKGEQPDRGPVHLELTIKGDHITAKRLDNAADLGEGTYKITIVQGQPMQMDGTKLLPRGRTQLFVGICAIEGDTLKWCVATPRNERPTEFETKERGKFLLILKRQSEKP